MIKKSKKNADALCMRFPQAPKQILENGRHRMTIVLGGCFWESVVTIPYAQYVQYLCIFVTGLHPPCLHPPMPLSS